MFADKVHWQSIFWLYSLSLFENMIPLVVDRVTSRFEQELVAVTDGTVQRIVVITREVTLKAIIKLP